MDDHRTQDRIAELRRMAEQLARLVEVSITLNSTLNVEELLRFIIRTALELLECEAVSILLHDEKSGRLFFADSAGSDQEKLSKLSIPLEGSIAGTIFRENRPIILNDVMSDPRHYVQVSKYINFEPRNLLGVPMRIRDRVTGVLEALNKKEGGFTEADQDMLAVIASQAAVAIHNAHLLQALQVAYDDLNEADKLKTNFLALASHELRTPLGIIIGYASFLQDESHGELSEHAEHVLNAAMQMRSLVDAMTNLNMLRAKGLVLRTLVMPIQKVLRSACDEIRPLAEAKNQELLIVLPEKSIPVQADPERLATVFSNLLNNAIRFTPEGGRIMVGAQEQLGNVLVWVEDNGIGIPPGELKRIFQPFHQAEPHMTRRHGGLGIGLAIAQGLAEAHGGKMWAESEGQGKGACFKVSLPLAKTE
ncbi:MAG: GAF domain-containing sensor histidine kinase [Chloroflexi bacterium]|nr:GAF domain-containing sensor histidine kinase [Chloroflexota bacterium]